MISVETAWRVIADAGLQVGDVDGFVTASLFPTAGAHAALDGVSLVSSNWLAEHRREPRVCRRFPGLRPTARGRAIAVNAVVSGAADYVLVHRALHNPPGKYHANPMTEVSGALQWTPPQGYFGPLSMIASDLQRVPPARRSIRRRWQRCSWRPARTGPGSRGRTGTKSRSGRRTTWPAMINDPIRRSTAISPSTGGLLRPDVK